MATGPDHYREGERLLEGQPVSDEEQARGIKPGIWPPSHLDVLAAQAHFTAALVAVLAEAKLTEYVSWQKAVGW
ncbi:hypothetical protein [Streptomyces stelliscabiei]|uniref:Uncharacterized protein n=1 Tax=Streptomyces stelliscabiei TaxID=146820 RepID=A0A8I0TR86_9ACTN|nr:hypothetical protein [Streptomyces stelliscabiei]KND45379.1 hypothetical protein IQ64_07255 [Streptomyces stelliscabiei]MBE1597232.1 hypothetical protein [Streptomyces stelliscabiei]